MTAPAETRPIAPPRAPAAALAALHAELRQMRCLEADSEALHSLQGRRMAVLVARALGDELSCAERRVAAAAAALAASLEAAGAADGGR